MFRVTMDIFIPVLFTLILLILGGLTLSWLGSGDKSLPPGPPTLPLLGNIHLIPRTGLHLKYTKWAKSYGNIFSLKIGQGTMIVLSSARDAVRLMDKRSAHYSHRPPSHIIGDLVFDGDHPMFMSADERWKLRRKLYHQMLQETMCNKQHIPLLEAESSHLLRDICRDPDALMLHPGRFSNSVTMSLVFGIRTPTHDTPHYLKLRNLMTQLSGLGEIGATPPVDFLPILKYVPPRLWGNWKSRVHALRETITDLYSPLVDMVITRRARGERRDSFLDGVLDQQAKLQLSRHEIDIMCGNLIEGGSDTMATLILTLCQAMALHPHVQEEAHSHIDSVMDESTLPSWADYERLPYVAMIIKELHRWRPPAPAGFPHATDQDDEIDGKKIPKGTSVVINIWGIHHDPSRYAAPETFNPHRFQGQTQLSPVYANSGDYQKRDHFGYGIGRRICPGIHLAERALFIAIARILWAFTIEPKVDAATGKQIPIDIDPTTGYTEGFLNQCFPFEVEIRPRSEKRVAAILADTSEAETEILRAFA